MIKKKFKKLNIYKNSNVGNTFISQGVWGLKSLSTGILTKKQLESARKVLVGKTKRGCKIWIKVNFNTPITQKGKGSRMGKGSGVIVDHVCNVTQGRVIFEVFFNSLFSNKFIKQLLISVSKKFSFRTRLCKKQNIDIFL